MKEGVLEMGSVILLILIVAGGVAFLMRGIRARDKTGINIHPVSCPRCGAEFSRVRVPRTMRQALWGGRTCAACGCETDKWGREIPPR
jgi:hypothetical protein